MLLVTVFFPWRTWGGTAEVGGKGVNLKVDFGGFGISPNIGGIHVTGGVITLILAIVGAAFPMVGVFVPNRALLKASLWTGFGAAVVSMGLALLCALVKSSAGADAGFVKMDLGTLKGAWGAWVAAGVALAAGVMFLVTVMTLAPEKRARRRPARDDDY